MTKKIKYLLITLTCLTAVLIFSIQTKTMVVISGFVPYLAFCACSLIVRRKGSAPSNIWFIFVAGLVILPVLDFLCQMFFTIFPNIVIGAGVITFVQAGIYFMLFVHMNSLGNKGNKAFKPAHYAVMFALVLIYSVLEAAGTVSLANAMNDAVSSGTLVSWLSALNSGYELGIIANVVFYGALLYTSTRFVREN